MKEEIKVKFVGRRPKEEEEGLFYYDLRDSEVDNGYTIEKVVGVNNIGSLISNVDLLNGKEYITDEDLDKMNVKVVTSFN